MLAWLRWVGSLDASGQTAPQVNNPPTREPWFHIGSFFTNFTIFFSNEISLYNPGFIFVDWKSRVCFRLARVNIFYNTIPWCGIFHFSAWISTFVYVDSVIIKLVQNVLQMSRDCWQPGINFLARSQFGINPHWHELGKQEKCSSLVPLRGIFYKTQSAGQGMR